MKIINGLLKDLIRKKISVEDIVINDGSITILRTFYNDSGNIQTPNSNLQMIMIYYGLQSD